MRITFDTNTLDKAARPARYPKDARQTNYLKVHQALSAGVLRGYFSETSLYLFRPRQPAKVSFSPENEETALPGSGQQQNYANIKISGNSVKL
jgi:hypothetical protein